MEINSLKTIEDIVDIIYPIGCYFETSDGNFDPNRQIGGTWERLNDGRVLIAEGSIYEIGDTGGEDVHTLAIGEIPYHNHRGKVTYDGKYQIENGGVQGGNTFNALSIGNNGHEFRLETEGGNLPHNNMQPYVVVARWHRTA